MPKLKNKNNEKSFFDQVYAGVRRVPKGKVATYGQIAKLIGTKDSRKVGWALHANKDENTPCHRVVNKNGELAKTFAFGGAREQRNRLEAECIEFVDKMHVDLEKYLWQVGK